jgi:(1->4)-alpha-D-glucan 1-alpha-D-glucosylmutase
MDGTANEQRLSSIPRATARLQFHGGFTFDDATVIVPYLAELNISHLYASPILRARSGSTHGYDVIDPSQVNPELGGEAALRRLVNTLRAHGMGLIIDIVPNHMAVGGADNPWWLDVLEWGQESPYAKFFDIDFDVPDTALKGRVLAPFLGKPYGEALADDELVLRFDGESGRIFVAYYGHRFPIAPGDYGPLLRASGELLAEHGRAFREAVGRRLGRPQRRTRFAEARHALAQAAATPKGTQAIGIMLEHFSVRDPAGRGRLNRLLDRQHYRLAWWRAAPDEINWRRFFDVIDLAALRVQEPAVFDAVHETVLRLYEDGTVDGFRVDHVDGLADPRGYCRTLRAHLTRLEARRPAGVPAGPAYLVVEKILAPQERLNSEWMVDGTSGYVFMNEVGALLHDPDGEAPLTQLWRQWSGATGSFENEERSARRRIPQELLAADFNACAHALHSIARSSPETRDWTLLAIRRVLTEFLVHFPVYRTYADARGRSSEDAAIMARVVAQVKETCRPGERALVDLVDRWLGGEAPRLVSGAGPRRARLRALARFQQLTSPVAAKSVEDTAFYRHGRLLSRNEVGANPDDFSITVQAFHAASLMRLRRYPHAMLATATHDHKRGEDVRARLAVLSEIPNDWAQLVEQWRALNARLRYRENGIEAPDGIDEYILYQMLVGAWPLELAVTDRAGLGEFAKRLSAWQQKAVREAKRQSGWIEPNLDYEQGCERFLEQLLSPEMSGEFLAGLARFVARVARAGAVNGLTQVLLRLTSPGVPDLYQGTEFWDFSLVDPDNRRPVNYRARLQALKSRAPISELIWSWRDGRLKQRLIERALQVRRHWPQLFAEGTYTPLRATGRHQHRVVAFCREEEEHALLVLAVRLPAPLLDETDALHTSAAEWDDTAVTLPASLQRREWVDVLSGRKCGALQGRIPVIQLLGEWPGSLLATQPFAH